MRVIDFDRARLSSDSTKASVLGTPGYFPESYVWLDGDKKWDIWALSVIICEADMALDEYLYTKKEKDANIRLKKHADR